MQSKEDLYLVMSFIICSIQYLITCASFLLTLKLTDVTRGRERRRRQTATRRTDTDVFRRRLDDTATAIFTRPFLFTYGQLCERSKIANLITISYTASRLEYYSMSCAQSRFICIPFKRGVHISCIHVMFRLEYRVSMTYHQLT